jgi:hypothetical protein
MKKVSNTTPHDGANQDVGIEDDYLERVGLFG